MPRLPGLHLPICPPFFNNQLAIRDAARTTNSWRIGVGKLMAPWTPKGTDNHHWGTTAAQLHRTTNSPPHTTDTSSTTHKCRRALLLQGRVACFFFLLFFIWLHSLLRLRLQLFPLISPTSGFGFVYFSFCACSLLFGFSAFLLPGMLMTLEAAPKVRWGGVWGMQWSERARTVALKLWSLR